VPSAITRPWSKHGDAVGEAVRLLEVLRGQQDGRPAGDAVLDRVPQRAAAARVEAGGRLVEEQHRRAGDERGREVEPAAHAARVGLGGAVAGVLELELLEQIARALHGTGPCRGVEASDHLEVLEAGEVLVDSGVLPGEADGGAQLRRLGGDVEAGDAGAPGVRLEQRREDPHRGRLAGAVWPQEAEHGALLRLEVDAVEGDHIAVGLGQAAGGDGGLGHRPSNVLVVLPACPHALGRAQPAPGHVLGRGKGSALAPSLRPRQASACIPPEHARTHRTNH
jgi:hypothetical protein